MPEQAYGKVCTKCGEVKPRSEYYVKRERGKERPYAHCRACHGGITQTWRVANRERVNDAQSARRAGPDGERYRARQRASMAANPQQVMARELVRQAVRRGAMVRPDCCEDCGEDPGVNRIGNSLLHAHHDDYERPLDVRWLCISCHVAHHHPEAKAA